MSNRIPPLPNNVPELPRDEDGEDWDSDRYHRQLSGIPDQTAAERQEENSRYVNEAMQGYLQHAVHELGALMLNPKASSAQVKACEIIINRMAGKGGRFVNIGDMRGKSVHEAMDMIFAAMLAGTCSVEDGKELVDMLSKRAGREVEALGQEIARLTQMLDQRGIK